MPAIAASLPELQRWMPWAQAMPSAAGLLAVLEAGEIAFDGDQGWDYVAYEVASDSLVGGAGLHRRAGPKVGDIGYWTRSDRARRGYATATAKALTEVAFDLVPDIERVEVHMDRANEASVAVPRKLGFRLDREEVRLIEAPGHSGIGFVWVLERQNT